MPFIRRRRLEQTVTEAVQKALGVPAAAQGGSPVNPAVMASQIQRIGQQTNAQVPAAVDQAMTAQGFDQATSFSPGRPITPFAGYSVEPRQYDYTPGHNINSRPRSGRIGFETLRAVIDNYDIARICINHRIDDVRSLDWSIVAADGVETDVTAAIQRGREALARPDGRNPFPAWLGMWLEDVLRYDAGALYRRRDNAGRVIGLEVVDGTTMAPQLDYWGRRPAPPAPAYVQFIEGLPWDWLTSDDVIYQPFRPQSSSPYGLAPMESVLLTANSDIRFQQFFLEYFTEGSIPGGIMEAPEDMSDPDQLERWQELWDTVMMGDQAQKHQVRWVPAGSRFQALRDYPFDDKFPLFLLHKTCAAFGVTPNDLGFTDNVNRAVGETQVDVQFRVGSLPLIRHVEGVLTGYLQDDLGLPVKFQIDTGQEKEDRETLAKAWQIGVFTGAVSADEMRAEVYGLPVDNSRPLPRFVLDSRTGPVPLRSIFAIAGPTDPATGAPVDTVPLDTTPFAGAGGVLPDKQPGGTQFKRAPIDPDEPQFPALEQEVPGSGVVTPPAPATPPAATPAAPAAPGGLQGTDVTGQPLVRKDATAGVTAATGIVGVDLHGAHTLDDDDTDDDGEDEVRKDLDRWRDNARSRIRKGQQPRRFADTAIPADLAERIWAGLQHATSREQVDDVFRVVKSDPKGPSPAARWAGHRHDLQIAEHYATPIHQAMQALAAGLTGPARDIAGRLAERSAGRPPDLGTVAKSLADNPDYQTARAELASAQPDTSALEQALRLLWADSWAAGTHAAALTVGPGAQIAAGLDVIISGIDWGKWTPGDPATAALLSSPDAPAFGLTELLDQAGVTVKGIVDTTLDRTAAAIANGIAAGDPPAKIARSLRDVAVTPDRADMIARTETARAMSASAVATYRYNGQSGKKWLVMEPCPVCAGNEAAGIIPLDEDFPSGDAYPPAHPRCRCAVTPATLDQ